MPRAAGITLPELSPWAGSLQEPVEYLTGARVSLLAAERIKLVSTGSAWLCTVIAVVASAGFGAVFLIVGGDETQVSVGTTQVASSFGRTAILVMAVLAATAEFRWGTMGTTFQAAPNRVRALLAKGVVVAGWSALVGLVAGFGSWLLGSLLSPDVDLSLRTPADWRAVAGGGPLFALTALFGLGVGLLVRRTGFAVVAVLVWSQLVESLVVLIPGIGDNLYEWMPFFAASQYSGGDFTASEFRLEHLPLSPLGYGAYFAAICVVLFAVGVLSNTRRHSDD